MDDRFEYCGECGEPIPAETEETWCAKCGKRCCRHCVPATGGVCVACELENSKTLPNYLIPGTKLKPEKLAKGLCGEGRCTVSNGTCDSCQLWKAKLKLAEQLRKWLLEEV